MLSGTPIVFAVLAAASAHAQSSAPAEASPQPAWPATVGDIIVTTNKRQQSVIAAGMSITAVSSDQLAARGILNVTNLPKLVPGLTVQQSAFNSASYNLPGIGFFNSELASPTAVSIYVDEVPVSFPSMTRLSRSIWSGSKCSRARKGPCTVRNSTGGAVNHIAAKPTSTLTGEADVSYGRFNTVDFAGFISGPLADGVKARLAVKINIADAAFPIAFRRSERDIHVRCV